MSEPDVSSEQVANGADKLAELFERRIADYEKFAKLKEHFLYGESDAQLDRLAAGYLKSISVAFRGGRDDY